MPKIRYYTRKGTQMKFYNVIAVPTLIRGLEIKHGNYFFLAILTDREETWKYTNGSG